MSQRVRLAVQLLGVFMVISLLFFGVYSFNLVLVLAAFLASFLIGRLFCGWFCPLGTFMEYIISRFSRRTEVPSIIKHKGVRFLFLSVFALFMVWSLTALPRLWASFLLVGVMFVLGTVLGLLYSPKTWCAYVCPWGTLMSVTGRRALLTHQLKGCKKCYLCATACFKPEMLKGGLKAAENSGSMPKLADCLGCQQCAERCPQQALKIV